MIIYKDVLGKLIAAGYTTYRIRKEKLIPESTMQKLRSGGSVTTETIDTLCRLLHCQPGDLMEYAENESL
jgi:putative transcriptional regulator